MAGSANTSSAYDPLYWDDAYPIALVLKAAHPDTDPTAIDHHILHEWVIRLEGFVDDPQVVRAEWLEQIQAEWVELG
ncbi:MAG: Fe-S cluster assembly protein IscX [Chloroflexi bacterium]|nr:Fe-S cluster assembly protein IscX [Chloroflexota bacterium]